MGEQHALDLAAIIPDKTMSIADGAIVPLGESRDAYFYKMIEQLAKKKKFSLKVPIGELSQEMINLVLFGNEDGLLIEPDEVLEEKDKNKQAYEGVGSSRLGLCAVQHLWGEQANLKRMAGSEAAARCAHS